jgi:sugar/nucleoside kinase (ribokinase family)
VVFGEFFLDLVFFKLPSPPRMGEEVKTIHFAEFPGGGLATTSLVAAGLGTPTAIVTRVGADAQRHPAWQNLVRGGIHTVACEFSRKFPTAMTVCAAYGGDRLMITTDAINQKLHRLLERPSVRQQFRNAKHVHLACALTPLPFWISAIRKLRSQGLTISADIGWNPKTLQSPRLPAVLRQCHFAFPNEIEAITITGERSVENAARRLAQWVPVPVVKLGRMGCLAVQNGKLLRVKSIRVRSTDATGAGDAFNGAFLHGYTSGWSLEDCLRAGNVCGAMATTLPGGASVILSRGKLLELMKRI